MYRLTTLATLCIMILWVISLISCDNEPKPVIVTYQLTHRADTTFHKHYRDSIRIEMDSFCVQNNEALFNQVRDSLLRVELEKMEKLMYEK